MNTDQPTQELDLAIPDMDSGTAETEVARLLEKLPGLIQVRLLERGAFIRYHAETITHQQICEVLRRAGFRASTFQDSASGETGLSSQ
jgi:hypothetical protein